MAAQAIADAACIVEGCCKPVQARNWCSKHYQSFYLYGDPLKAGKSKKCCSVCGAGFIGTAKRTECSELCRARKRGQRPIAEILASAIIRRDYHCEHCKKQFKPTRTDRLRFCCKDCAYAAQRESAENRKKQLDGPHRKVWFSTCIECACLFAARSRVGRFCKETCRARYEKRKTVGIKPQRKCGECGEAFISKYGDKHRKFCSDECCNVNGRRIRRARRRALEKAAHVENVDPIVVFDRDGWKCQMCGIDTPRHLRGTYEGRAPELDHIIPLSRNGEHSYRNTQCLCRSCNARKSDQVLLVVRTGWMEGAAAGGA